MATPGTRSTADERRSLVIAKAVDCFAGGGWAGTTFADVAAACGISTAYVIKLFPRKEHLFVAALESCFSRIEHAVDQAATASAATSPAARLDEMGEAYARLISDRSVLMMQVHAQSAAAVPGIGAALRAGLEHLTVLVSERSGADDQAVQRFMAFGQLCHLVVTTQVDRLDTPGARLLSAGIRHYDEPR